MADIVYEIKRHYGVIGEDYRGWKKEINLISWNNRKPKLDIRDWAPEHEKMGKGVTLGKEELQELKNLLPEIGEEDLE